VVPAGPLTQGLEANCAVRCRELLRETPRAHEIVVHAGWINRDHVHMLLIPRNLWVSRSVRDRRAAERSGFEPQPETTDFRRRSISHLLSEK